MRSVSLHRGLQGQSVYIEVYKVSQFIFRSTMSVYIEVYKVSQFAYRSTSSVYKDVYKVSQFTLRSARSVSLHRGLPGQSVYIEV